MSLMTSEMRVAPGRRRPGWREGGSYLCPGKLPRGEVSRAFLVSVVGGVGDDGTGAGVAGGFGGVHLDCADDEAVGG